MFVPLPGIKQMVVDAAGNGHLELIVVRSNDVEHT